MKSILSKFFVCLSLFTFLITNSSSTFAKSNDDNSKPLIEQIAGDLVSAGITVGASLSGNVPLALASGLLAKYITVYGIGGVKKLISFFKSNSPQDLGEVNLYYIYLLNIKRNLYFTLINIRQASKEIDRDQNVEKALIDISNRLVAKCQDENCTLDPIDETLVNFNFINMALDMKQSLDINKVLMKDEIKATYQYLSLLYLDIILVEQKIIEAQYDVLANSTATIIEELENNPYISQGEKEYRYQLALNIALRWTFQRDLRRKNLLPILENSLGKMNSEADDLDSKLDEYKNKYGSNSSDESEDQIEY